MRPATAAAVALDLFLEQAGGANGVVEFHGESMQPLLRDGDALSIERVSFAQVHPGDLVVFRFDDRHPTLRVARKLEEKLFLIADNWPGPVFEAWQEDLIGRVVGYRRDGVDVSCQSVEWRRAAAWAVMRYRLRVAAASVRAEASSRGRGLRAHVEALRFGTLGIPQAIHLNVSARCNLSCRMCPYLGVHGSADYTSSMSPETFERLVPTIRRAGWVTFSGSGEPLFNKNLVSYLRRVRSEGPGVRIDLTTNGTLLSPEVSEELVRLPVDMLTVSIDGATAETVQSIRRNSDFGRIIGNIRHLAERKRTMGATRPVIAANYMTGFGTYRELPDFLYLAKEIGIEVINLLEIQPASQDDTTDNLAASARRDDGQRLKYAIKLSQRLGIKLELPRVSPNACLFPYVPHVSESGNVNPCCFMDYEGRTLFDGREQVRLPALSFGNVNDSGFRAIWNGRAFHRFRRRNKRGDFPDGCRTCFQIRNATAESVHRIVGPRPQQAGR